MTKSARVTWPNGNKPFYITLKGLRDEVLTGTVVALDPSSGSRDSQPGYAVFVNGVLTSRGTLRVSPKLPIYERLQLLYDRVAAILPAPPDVFAIEKIHKGMSHQFLQWAVGVSIAAARGKRTLEVPIAFWKAYAKLQPEYGKGDEADAVAIGASIIQYCKELPRDKAAS